MALADFGHHPRSSNSLRGRRNFVVFFGQVNNARFHRFPVGQIYEIWTQQRRSVRRWKLSEQNFKKFTIRGRFSEKHKNCSQNFQALPLQTIRTLQWLQIAGNSLPNWSSIGCLVSIFSARINSKSFPGLYAPYSKRTYPNFRQRPMSDIEY